MPRLDAASMGLTSRPFSELPYRPCVGIALANRSGQVFAGRRIDSDTPAWQMPQGGIDEGESPQDAALRELGEETGVAPDMVTVEARMSEWLRYDLPRELAPKLWKGKYRGQEQLWFLLRFRGTDDQISIETEQPEFAEWAWLDTHELVEKIVPFKRDVYARVIAEFGDRLA